jgi:hypothetical protein
LFDAAPLFLEVLESFETLRDLFEPDLEPLRDLFEPDLDPLPDLLLPLPLRDDPLRLRLRLCLDPEFEREREAGDFAPSEPKIWKFITFQCFKICKNNF